MQLRHRVFKHVQLMPLRLLDKFSAGRLITGPPTTWRPSTNCSPTWCSNLFKDIFLLIGLVFVMVQLDWRLALLSFTALPVIGVFVFLVRTKLRRNFQIVKSLIRPDQRLLRREYLGHAPGADLQPAEGEVPGV